MMTPKTSYARFDHFANICIKHADKAENFHFWACIMSMLSNYIRRHLMEDTGTEYLTGERASNYATQLLQGEITTNDLYLEFCDTNPVGQTRPYADNH